MISTIGIGLLVALGVAILVVARLSTKGWEPLPAWPAYVMFAVALIWAVFACTAIVQAKQVGVLTTFGKPSERTLDSGLHVKLPWQKVTQIDATIQTDEYRGDGCIYVRLGDGQTACVTATNRWRVLQAQADHVYADYRSDDPTESLRDAVVSTQFKAAVNGVFGKYDPTAPLAELDPTDPATSTAGINFSPDYDALAQAVLDSMNARLTAKGEPLVDIDSITISYLKLSDKTQAKIDAYQSEVAKTQIALQSQATNAAQAEANRILAESLAKNPNVLVARCFDLIADGDLSPPPGFSCWAASSAVVLPATGGAK